MCTWFSNRAWLRYYSLPAVFIGTKIHYKPKGIYFYVAELWLFRLHGFLSASVKWQLGKCKIMLKCVVSILHLLSMGCEIFLKVLFSFFLVLVFIFLIFSTKYFLGDIQQQNSFEAWKLLLTSLKYPCCRRTCTRVWLSGHSGLCIGKDNKLLEMKTLELL